MSGPAFLRFGFLSGDVVELKKVPACHKPGRLSASDGVSTTEVPKYGAQSSPSPVKDPTFDPSDKKTVKQLCGHKVQLSDGFPPCGPPIREGSRVWEPFREQIPQLSSSTPQAGFPQCKLRTLPATLCLRDRLGMGPLYIVFVCASAQFKLEETQHVRHFLPPESFQNYR